MENGFQESKKQEGHRVTLGEKRGDGPVSITGKELKAQHVECDVE